MYTHLTNTGNMDWEGSNLNDDLGVSILISQPCSWIDIIWEFHKLQHFRSPLFSPFLIYAYLFSIGFNSSVFIIVLFSFRKAAKSSADLMAFNQEKKNRYVVGREWLLIRWNEIAAKSTQLAHDVQEDTKHGATDAQNTLRLRLNWHKLSNNTVYLQRSARESCVTVVHSPDIGARWQLGTAWRSCSAGTE